MKGGVVLSLGVMRALASRSEDYAEVALLLVCDEEWRTAPFGHVERFAGFDACLCFEGGARTPDGEDGVVVRRKAAGTLKVRAEGRASHSGSAPDRGRNALLALAAAAQAVASCHDPDGPDRLTAVPTVLHSGEAFNVVPGEGELVSDMRADSSDAFQRVVDAIPNAVGGATLHPDMVRLWPGMDADRSDRAAARAGRRGARPPGDRDAARRGQRRQPLRLRDRAHRRRARAARRRRPQPRGVHRRRLAGVPRGGRARARERGAQSRVTRERLELARAQQHDQLGAGAVEADRGDRALLEVDAPAGEVVDDLRERRLVADDEHAGAVVVAVHELERVLALEAVAEHVLVLGLGAERLGRQPGGVRRAPLRARVDRRELDAEPRQRRAGRHRLALAAGGQLTVGVVVPRVVRHRLAVPEEPELPRHGAEGNRPINCERRGG